MLVLAKISFVAVHDGQTYSVQEGNQIDMPHGADWVRAGFVTPVMQDAPETSTLAPTQNAAMPKAKAKKR